MVSTFHMKNNHTAANYGIVPTTRQCQLPCCTLQQQGGARNNEALKKSRKIEKSRFLFPYHTLWAHLGGYGKIIFKSKMSNVSMI